MATELQKERLKFLEELLQPRNVEDTKQLYSEWSDNYEEDIKDMGYNGASIVVSCFLELNCPKTAKILDIGCGTGMVGDSLKKLGYSNMDGVDASPKMLAIAKEKNCYNNLIESVVSSEVTLPIQNKVYDVVIMSGVFCPGHIKYDALTEILRVAKSGGTICWSMCVTTAYSERDEQYRDGKFERYVESLCDKRKWISILGYPKPVQYYLHGESGWFYAMQVI